MLDNGILWVTHQLFRRSFNIWVYLLIVLRDPDSDYYRETLCNYLNLRTALLS